MNYIEPFRNPDSVRELLFLIERRSRRPVRLMEFCGGHTHAIMRFGLRQLLPSTVQLLSGPGCPVCVTARKDVDRAIHLARTQNVVLATFGDMVRVPGSSGSLEEAKAQGADVRIVYSALDALDLARGLPHREVVFLAVGFETTAPTVAATILQARAEGVSNFSVLCLHKLTPPAMQALLGDGRVALSGVIGPGHVTTIIGSRAWDFLPLNYGIPCAVTGFEPVDILRAIYELVDMIESDSPEVRNVYTRSVRSHGNPVAKELMQEVFRVVEAEWRGLGSLQDSGLNLAETAEWFDADVRFPCEVETGPEPLGCICGEVLRGIARPEDCPLFSKACSPAHPVGPCMVSGEGACSAYIQYREE